LPAALAEVMSNRNFSNSDMLGELFRVWIQRDAKGAGLHLAKLPPSKSRYYTRQRFAMLWAKRDPNAVKAWAATISEPGSNSPLLSFLNAKVVGQGNNTIAIDRRGAFEKYITTNKARLDPEVRRTVLAMAYGVAQKDLDLVRQAAAAAEDPEERRALSTAVAVQLATNDPDSVAAYLETMPAADRRQAFDAYQKWVEHDPAKALAHFQKDLPPEVLNNPFQLSQTLRRMLAPAMVKDPAAVAAVVLELDAQTRAEALYDVGQKWCRTDGAAAAAWAAALPAGPARDESIRQFIAAWAVHDSLQVTAFINALPPGSAKSAAVEGFAGTNFDTDPDASLAWIRTIPDEQDRLRALKTSWGRWCRMQGAPAYMWREKATDLSPQEQAALKEY
jgi:hypothetical protein